MTLLIDGDLLLYRTGFAIERTKYLVELINPSGHPEFKKFDTKKDATKYIDNVTMGVKAQATIWSRKDLEPVEHGYKIIDATLNDLIKKYTVLDTVTWRIFISGATNFRDKVWKTKKYKGNRDAQVKPTHYEELKQYLIERYGAEVTDGIEADDAIGSASSSDSVCVSLDKDLDQIPGRHYDWVNHEEYDVSLKDAKTMLFAQIMAGDYTDNVPGLKGVGITTALKMLAQAKNPVGMAEITAAAYRDQFGGEWYNTLNEMAELVYIRRGTPWQQTREFKMFEDIYNRGQDAEAA